MKDEVLIEKANEVRKNSYSPYSNFSVGAAIQSIDGEVFLGTNIENQVNGLSICAERVALFNAIKEGKRKFSKIAVMCSNDFCSPCGACRQVLYEHSPNLEIIMANVEGEYKKTSLGQLLPEGFKLD